MPKHIDPQSLTNLGPVYVPMTTGLFLNPSRIQAPVGSLSQVRNFEVVNGAYEETQGLTMVGPTLSEGLDDFWHASLATSDCVTSGTLVAGDLLYWYAYDGVTVAGTGRMYYVSAGASEIVITLDKVAGVSPRRATSLYSTSGATLVYSGTGDTFTHQSKLGLTWQQYLGDEFLGALTESQREQSTTWDAFKPDPLGVQGISGVFQFRDHKYAVRDFWGGKFATGVEEPSLNDFISVEYAGATGTFTAVIKGWELTDGSWEAGDAEGILFLAPAEGTSTDMAETANWDASTTITNTTTGNTLGTTLASGTRQYRNKGLLWKRDAEARQGGWKLVDLGYSLSFDTGTVAPIATVAPLIVTDSVESITDTGWDNLISPATEYPTTGTYTAWSNLGNMDSTTAGVYASTTITAGAESRVLELALDPSMVQGDARILGVEVQITAHQTVGADVVIGTVQLRNSNGTSTYLSGNRADRDTLSTTTSTVYAYGSQLDLWELPEIDPDDLSNGSYTLLVQFENPGASARTVNVDLVQIKVHYALQGQFVYIYDGASDVAAGLLYAYQVFDGEWSNNDAEGWMTLHEVTNPSNIKAGMQIRTAASGAGDLVAMTRTLTANLLPSLEDLDNAGTIYQSRRAVFSGNEDSEAIYVATGASPAFMLDKDDRFSFIRLPVDRDKDTPRFVEFHRNHLILSVGSHFLVSSIGTPNNFNTYDGATSWNPKDVITGLAAAANGTTLVLCEDSVHAFTGTGASGQDQFGLRIITDNSGGRPYTLTNLLGNVFVDYAGITTADISDKYGGFEIGRKSAHIRTLLRQLLGSNSLDITVGNRIVGAIPVRKKNQYRIYLSSGDIITATFPDDPQQPLQFTHQHYTAYHEDDIKGYEALFVPTSIDSSVTSNGEESILIGTRLGHVMQVDPGYMDVISYANKNTTGSERRDDATSWKFFKFLDLNPLHSEDASRQVVYKSGQIYLEHAGYSEVNLMAQTDYAHISEVPVIGEEDETIGNTHLVGDITLYPGELRDDYLTWYLDEATDGLSIRLSKFGGIGSVPMRVTAMHLHAEAKGQRHNRIHSSRAYEVTSASIPNDIYVEGIIGTASAYGTTGSLALNLSVTGISGTASATGNTGEVSLTAGLWTWDDTSFTFDNTTKTFDGTS